MSSNSLKGATKATEINLPESVTEICGNLLGSNWQHVHKLKLGKNVKQIDSWAFAYGLDNFTLEIDKENPYYTVENNVLYSKDKKTLYRVIYKIRGKFTIDSAVETLASRTFEAQNLVTEIELDKNLKTIGKEAFVSCTSLSEIEIPSSVDNIEEGAFQRCGNLKNVIIDKKENSISGSPWGLPIGQRGIKWK